MLKRTGQVSVEYTTLAIVVIGALIAGGVYFKRGIQGRWKAAVDEIGEQYDPAYMNSAIKHYMSSNSATLITTVPNPAGGYWTIREDQANITDKMFGHTSVASATL